MFVSCQRDIIVAPLIKIVGCVGPEPINNSTSLSVCVDGVMFPLADQNECQVNNGGCSHECKDMEMGFYCNCPENMKLVGDTQCEGEWQLDGLMNAV